LAKTVFANRAILDSEYFFELYSIPSAGRPPQVFQVDRVLVDGLAPVWKEKQKGRPGPPVAENDCKKEGASV
jgi:hypothetical protein